MRQRIVGRLRPVPQDRDHRGPRLLLTQGVVRATERLLPTYGVEEPHEGIVYLGGLTHDAIALAVTAIAPQAVTSRGSFVTDTASNTELIRALARHRCVLIGQVHSHPGGWVDHSDGDDRGALVRFENYWSLVVPDYGATGLQPLARCGIHCYRSGAFRRLTPEAIQARVQIIPDQLDLRHGGRCSINGEE